MEPYQLGRLEDMKEFLREDAETLRRERRKKMDAIYADRGQVIKNDLETVLKGLADGKGDGRLVISCLRSSYITGSFDFYIAFYAGEPFVEEEPDSAYYSMAVFWDGIGEDLERMGKKLRRKFIRVMSSETEEIRRDSKGNGRKYSGKYWRGRRRKGMWMSCSAATWIGWRL